MHNQPTAVNGRSLPEPLTADEIRTVAEHAALDADSEFDRVHGSAEGGAEQFFEAVKPALGYLEVARWAHTRRCAGKLSKDGRVALSNTRDWWAAAHEQDVASEAHPEDIESTRRLTETFDRALEFAKTAGHIAPTTPVPPNLLDGLKDATLRIISWAAEDLQRSIDDAQGTESFSDARWTLQGHLELYDCLQDDNDPELTYSLGAALIRLLAELQHDIKEEGRSPDELVEPAAQLKSCEAFCDDVRNYLASL